MSEIKVEISADGAQVKVAGQGFAGPGCEEFVHNFTNALGQVKDEDHTDEYYLTEHVETNQ
jgi:hypothetical protein